MITTFIVNDGLETTITKNVSEEAVQSIIDYFNSFPLNVTLQIIAEDTTLTSPNRSLNSEQVQVLKNMILDLPEISTEPVSPIPPITTQETVEDVLRFYQLLPANEEEQAQMDADEVAYFKAQVNSLDTETMYYMFKRVAAASGNMEVWYEQMATIEEYLDFSNPDAVPFNPYSDIYREKLYAIICAQIEG